MANDELYELRNQFILGNYQGAINEALSFNPGNDQLRIERDVYLYRSYCAQGNYQLVIDEIKNNSPKELQAVKLMANYLSNESSKDICLVTLKEWLGDGVTANNPIFQFIAGMIYLHEQNFDEALRCVHQISTLEGHALLVQIYLKMDRLDLADKELKVMQDMDEDATATQLARAWLHSSKGGDKAQDAAYTFQELSDKFAPTPLLLNGLAVTHMQLKKYDDAERFLLEALEKSPKDPDTLANLAICSSYLRKPQEIINRYIK